LNNWEDMATRIDSVVVKKGISQWNEEFMFEAVAVRLV
jgi:hypothetical protein